MFRKFALYALLVLIMTTGLMPGVQGQGRSERGRRYERSPYERYDDPLTREVDSCDYRRRRRDRSRTERYDNDRSRRRRDQRDCEYPPPRRRYNRDYRY
jgi:hypothetical protein